MIRNFLEAAAELFPIYAATFGTLMAALLIFDAIARGTT